MKLDQANTIMENIDIDDETQAEIREFLLKTTNTRDRQELFDSFLDEISPSLQAKVQNALFTKILTKNTAICSIIGEDSHILVDMKPKRDSFQ